MEFIISLLLGVFTLLAISLQRTYGHVPEKELKRRARSGDSFAEGLHRAAAYGASLRALLWLMVVLFASVFFLYVSRHTATWFALLAIGLVVWFGFVWLPANEASKTSTWLAMRIAPFFAWILQWLHPVLNGFVSLLRRYRPLRVHTGLYDVDDLIQLFERQEVQADNRIDKATLEVTKHALSFGNKKVEDILTPRRVVKTVNVEETVGPVLMTELHASGFSRFPVYEGKQDNMVGVLYLRDLVNAKTGGQIRKIMHPQICFVHEDQSLAEALQAILKTHQHLYVVVNSFEEYVGIVTIEDILEEIVGKQIVDEFDQYDDMRAVAQIHAQKDHQENQHDKEETTEEQTDTVE
jgi:CBS domain containing-hemolysin-like protein